MGSPRNIVLGIGVGALVSLVTMSRALAQQAATSENASPQSESLEEIQVTGIRASIEAAQDIKREAPSVVEAITLADPGKFTHSSITNALQRLLASTSTRIRNRHTEAATLSRFAALGRIIAR
jgi:iron complex outermembrane receptor protein